MISAATFPQALYDYQLYRVRLALARHREPAVKVERAVRHTTSDTRKSWVAHRCACGRVTKNRQDRCWNCRHKRRSMRRAA